MDERMILRSRIFSALMFGACGAGVAICANLQHSLRYDYPTFGELLQGLALLFCLGMSAALVLVVILMLECLLRCAAEFRRKYLARRNMSLASGQVSLRELMIVMAVVAVFCALFRFIGVAVLPLAALLALLASLPLELWHLNQRQDFRATQSAPGTNKIPEQSSGGPPS